MSRVASHSYQAGEGLSLSDVADNAVQINQPYDPFEDLPHGTSYEEVGFGSLAFEDSVIVDRVREDRPLRQTRPSVVSPEQSARLRLAVAFSQS